MKQKKQEKKKIIFCKICKMSSVPSEPSTPSTTSIPSLPKKYNKNSDFFEEAKVPKHEVGDLDSINLEELRKIKEDFEL